MSGGELTARGRSSVAREFEALDLVCSEPDLQLGALSRDAVLSRRDRRLLDAAAVVRVLLGAAAVERVLSAGVV